MCPAEITTRGSRCFPAWSTGSTGSTGRAGKLRSPAGTWVFPAWCAVNTQPNRFLSSCPLAPPRFCPEVLGASALSCKLQLTLWLLPLKPRRGESNRTVNDGSCPFSDFSGTLRREQYRLWSSLGTRATLIPPIIIFFLSSS